MDDNANESGAQPPAGSPPVLAAPDQLKAVRQEQTKLTANFFNTIAGGYVTAGVIGPIMAIVLSYPDIPRSRAIVVGCATVAFLALG